MRVRKFVIGAGTVACLLSAVPAALAASPPPAGPIRVFITKQTATKDKVLVTGAIADYGTEVAEDANGKIDPDGNFEKVTLKQGGFTVNGTALPNAIQKQFSKEPINGKNCSLAFTGTGPSTIGSGTGAYAGISGKVSITLTVAGITTKNKKGVCNPPGPGPLYGAYQSATAAGSISFK
jgi:hypothetical protein